MISKISNFFTSIFTGFESSEERKKFSILASLFGITIGVYWMLRVLKDGVFFTVVGADYQPWAKMISTVLIACLVIVYSKLVDTFARHKILYGLSVFYAVISIIFAFFIFDPVVGISNTVESPDRYLGWFFYVFVESFGSLMVALFWSFVADTTTPESAKRGYPLIIFGAQTGGVLIPLMGKFITRYNSSGAGVLLCVVGICCIPVVVYYFMHNVSDKQLRGFESHGRPLEVKTKPKASFFDGLRLLLSSKYILGIFTIVTFYEIIITFIDFQFKSLAKGVYTGDALTDYLANYAILTNIGAVLCVVFGTKRIAHRLGLTRTLLLLPCVMGLAAITLSLNPMLTVALLIMVSCKSVNYSLNQPTKEQLYIPTSKDSKYKAKAWIDMFGIRFSKGLGSYFNTYRATIGAAGFTVASLGLSAILIIVWLNIALLLGKTHEKAIKEEREIC